MTAAIRNISVRKHAETTLRAKEHQLSIIFDNTYETIFVVGVEPNDCFRFISVNRSFTEALGVRQDQIVGKLVQQVIAEPACGLSIGKYKQAIRNRQPVSWEELSENTAGRKIGAVTVVPVFDTDGSCTQLIGTVHDITERKKAEERILYLNRVYAVMSGISTLIVHVRTREELFSEHNIAVRYDDYQHPAYSQVYPGFEPYMAAIDLLFNAGPASREILLKDQERISL